MKGKKENHRGKPAQSLKRFCDALKSKNNFMLASHVNPEGDAVGCVLAMESLLRRLGKKTLIVCEDPLPERLSCLYTDRWHQAKEIKKNRRFDALVVADCPTYARIGETRRFVDEKTTIFNIDHHVTNEQFGEYRCIQPKAAACGEVVYEIFKHLRMPLTKAEAKALYVTIVTDTGSFKYSNTTVRSHRIAAELIQTGIDIEKINDDLYAQYSLPAMKLYSRLMNKMQTKHHNQVAWTGLTRQDLRQTGTHYQDTEGFIDFLKYLKDVKYAFFLTESERPNEIRVSLRSKGKHNVSRIASRFGGGGHQKASGCTIRGTLKEAVRRVLIEIKKELRSQTV